METTVLLVRHGVTDWHAEGRLLGQRDLPLSDEGRKQAEAAARILAELKLADVVSSPLQRALTTAELIAARHDIQVARDPRLRDFEVGRWSGMRYDDIAATPEYQGFVADPLAEHIPGGEGLRDVQGRAVAAIEQALADSAAGDAIAVVTHAGVIRLLLAHYLGSAPANYHRIRVSPGSVSVLSFSDDRELPRVLATNYSASLVGITES